MTALILLDLQQGILNRFEGTDAYLSRVLVALDAARAAGTNIIHVRTCFRPGHPDISRRNATGGKVAQFGGFVEGDVAVEFSSTTAPKGEEIVVTKRRVSAFGGSDLDAVLRGLDVHKLVILGVATSGAVLSTVRQAADLDFDLAVLVDLCFDPDEEVHRVLVEKVFPRQGRTLNSEKWIQELKSNAT